MTQFMHHLDMRFKSYRGLKISAWVWACYQPLSMQQILPKTDKICKNLPNFEIPPEIEILVFFTKKTCTYRGGTRACFHHLDFQSKDFIYVFFIVKKHPLYVNFSIPAWGKWFFPQCSAPLVGMRFWGYVPNSLRNKNMKRLIPYLLFKMVFFCLQNSAVPVWRRGKKLFYQLWTLWSCKRWGMNM
jgi:hypothetical protein